MTRVIVVDDHPVFREGLRLLLDAHPDLDVVAEAADGQTGLELVLRHRPDVVVLDLDMPGLDGHAVLDELRRHGCATRVLVLTMHAQDARLARALAAGARGYLVKDAAPGEVLGAVRAVAAGQAILGATVAERGLAMAAAAGGPVVLPELTPREREILAGIARGLSNDEIAGELTVSVKTVRNVVSSIYLKLGVATRAQAAIRARAAGLVD